MQLVWVNDKISDFIKRREFHDTFFCDCVETIEKVQPNKKRKKTNFLIIG